MLVILFSLSKLIRKQVDGTGKKLQASMTCAYLIDIMSRSTKLVYANAQW